MLEIKNLSLSYPDKTLALDDITLHLKAGENVALIGANGAGKTSLLMAVVGILPVTGKIVVDGIELQNKTLSLVRQRTGVIFQNPDDQLFMPSVYEDIAFGLRNMGLPEDTVKTSVTQCLKCLQLEHLQNKTALKMSGGEKRMVALATVLAMHPTLTLFDEPTAFLDPRSRRNLLEVLKDLPQTKLVATHDLAFAAELCERSIILQNGRVVADGFSKELLYDARLMIGAGLEPIGG